MHLSTTQLQFLSRLAKTPDGLMLQQLLKAELAESDAKLRSATGEEVYRMQGRAKAVADLIDDITNAETRLTRSAPPATSRTLRAA